MESVSYETKKVKNIKKMKEKVTDDSKKKDIKTRKLRKLKIQFTKEINCVSEIGRKKE